MSIKTFLHIGIGISISMTTWAGDLVAKEDTTPPAAEGVLTVAQIPPLYSQTQPTPKQASVPVHTPQTTPSGNTPVAAAMPDLETQKAAAAATGVSEPTQTPAGTFSGNPPEIPPNESIPANLPIQQPMPHAAPTATSPQTLSTTNGPSAPIGRGTQPATTQGISQ